MWLAVCMSTMLSKAFHIPLRKLCSCLNLLNKAATRSKSRKGRSLPNTSSRPARITSPSFCALSLATLRHRPVRGQRAFPGCNRLDRQAQCPATMGLWKGPGRRHRVLVCRQHVQPPQWSAPCQPRLQDTASVRKRGRCAQAAGLGPAAHGLLVTHAVAGAGISPRLLPHPARSLR